MSVIHVVKLSILIKTAIALFITIMYSVFFIQRSLFDQTETAMSNIISSKMDAFYVFGSWGYYYV